MIIDFDVDGKETALEPCPTLRCCDCYYWTGNPGNMPTDFVCAVNIPRPSPAELDRVDGRKAYAYHDCQDFEKVSPQVSTHHLLDIGDISIDATTIQFVEWHSEDGVKITCKTADPSKSIVFTLSSKTPYYKAFVAKLKQARKLTDKPALECKASTRK